MTALERAYAECERMARSHYENFSIGSRLLPRRKRRHLAALYAYARGADDIADEPQDGVDRLAALDAWERELDAALAGRSQSPVFVAVADTLACCRLSDEPLRALLRAFRYDARFAPFADFTALRAYCRNSANPVGRLVLGLFDVDDEEAVRLSDEVCTGLQLTNFWQDLSVDLERGRCHLPEADVRMHPGARDALVSRRGNASFEALLALEIERARECLAAGDALAARVPWRLAFEVRLFARGGLRILDRVERLGARVLAQRPVLGTSDRIGVFFSGFAS